MNVEYDSPMYVNRFCTASYPIISSNFAMPVELEFGIISRCDRTRILANFAVRLEIEYRSTIVMQFEIQFESFPRVRLEIQFLVISCYDSRVHSS